MPMLYKSITKGKLHLHRSGGNLQNGVAIFFHQYTAFTFIFGELFWGGELIETGKNSSKDNCNVDLT